MKSWIVGIVLGAAPAVAPVASWTGHPLDPVLAACEAVQRLSRAVLQLETTLEGDVEVTNDFAARGAQVRRGCRVVGRDDGDRVPAPVDELLGALQAEGWQAPPRYQADGPDGSLVGVSRGETLCFIRGSWDGGDDSDTTYVPVPGYDLEVVCFHRTSADERPR